MHSIKKILPIVFLSIMFLSRCNVPSYTGKYYAKDCHLLDFVEVYPDWTADIKVKSVKYPVNYDIESTGKNSFRLQTNTLKLEFRVSGDTLYETSRIDIGCILTEKSD